ncbi:MAG: hypothetical protein ACP5LE_02775 [Thermoplasmata archaeon]
MAIMKHDNAEEFLMSFVHREYENLELWADVGRVLVWGILFNVLLITICLQVTLIR